MAKESLWQAAAGVCILLAATPAVAQTRHSPQYPQQSYQVPAANPALSIVGTYKSDAFFPSPLILTITGSIMSALAGYAIKELPARLRSTSDSAPKTESPSSVGLSVD